MRSDYQPVSLWFLGMIVATLGVQGPAAAAVTFPWATVGNPANPPDSNSSKSGSVPYTYQVSKTDVTNAQYVQFLNAVDPGGGNSLTLFSTGVIDAEFGITRNPAAANGSK